MTTETEKLGAALKENRRRRTKAARESTAARNELARLLIRGRGSFEVQELARIAGISRVTAHKLLRQATKGAAK